MEIGDVFSNRYILQRELARLASGNVYLAQDQQTKERVAIKWLPSTTANHAQFASRIRREAEVTSRMKGDRFVRVLEQGQTAAGDVFMIMEYLRGQQLTEILRHEAPLTVSRATGLARQALDALAAAHAQGIVHRDLKPKNIFVCDTADGGYVKVLDFGAAASAGSAGNAATTDINKLTARDSGLGTPDYMSPEQCRGGAVTAASDLYSLGVVLFETLTGAPPFNDPNPVQVMLMQLSRPAPALPGELGRTPLGRAVMTALEKDPAARFASAADFLRAIAPASGYSSQIGEQTARAANRKTMMLSTGATLPPEAHARPAAASGAGALAAGAASAARLSGASPHGGPPPNPASPAPQAAGRAAPTGTISRESAAGAKPVARRSKTGLLVVTAIVILLILLAASQWLLN